MCAAACERARRQMRAGMGRGGAADAVPAKCEKKGGACGPTRAGTAMRRMPTIVGCCDSRMQNVTSTQCDSVSHVSLPKFRPKWVDRATVGGGFGSKGGFGPKFGIFASGVGQLCPHPSSLRQEGGNCGPTPHLCVRSGVRGEPLPANEPPPRRSHPSNN